MQKWGLKRKESYISVIRVQELKSKIIFITKKPYLRNYNNSIVRKVWEELKVKYKKIIELKEYISEYYQNYITIGC